jgi:hypothetical protein
MEGFTMENFHWVALFELTNKKSKLVQIHDSHASENNTCCIAWWKRDCCFVGKPFNNIVPQENRVRLQVIYRSISDILKKNEITNIGYILKKLYFHMEIKFSRLVDFGKWPKRMFQELSIQKITKILILLLIT